LRTKPGKPGSTGVLRKTAKKGNCYIYWTKKQEISSYFPSLIAVIQNNILFSGSNWLRVKGNTMSSTTTLQAGSIPRRADNVEIAPQISEDWLSLIVGLLIFALALAGIANIDLLGWGVTTSVWTDVGKALAPVSKAYASLGGAGAILTTYVALLVILSVTVFALKSDLKRFALAFTAVFWIAYASWVVGSYANFAAVTPADMQKFGVSWSLKLTNEGGYIFALIAGLIIANFLPRFAESIKAAIRPELYIKIAIVILGGFVAVTAARPLSRPI